MLKQGGGEVVAAAASSGGDGRDGRDGGDLGPLAGVISLSGGLRVAKDGSPHLIASTRPSSQYRPISTLARLDARRPLSSRSPL